MHTLYVVTLYLHSYVRWLVLGLAVAVLVRSILGVRHQRAWERTDERVQTAFLRVLDVQFLLGLTLYVGLSPIARAFFGNPGASMRVSELRFFGMEHAVTMLIAIAVLHIGRARSRRKSDGPARHRSVRTSTLIGLLVILVGVPWPFIHAPRPLLRTTEAAGVPVQAPAGARAEGAPGAAACPPSYSARCAACHGADGGGDGVLAGSLEPRPRSFTEPGWIEKRSDAELLGIIRDGGAAHGLSPIMPPHGDLSAAELDALVACIHALAGAKD
ncbi:MAG TPA: cytochrome c [Polyangiaceae bacterium]|nr:cytochrome c [Polyangiaceae bacterium]